jgi:hypothetical protein
MLGQPHSKSVRISPVFLSSSYLGVCRDMLPCYREIPGPVQRGGRHLIKGFCSSGLSLLKKTKI